MTNSNLAYIVTGAVIVLIVTMTPEKSISIATATLLICNQIRAAVADMKERKS